MSKKQRVAYFDQIHPPKQVSYLEYTQRVKAQPQTDPKWAYIMLANLFDLRPSDQYCPAHHQLALHRVWIYFNGKRTEIQENYLHALNSSYPFDWKKLKHKQEKRTPNTQCQLSPGCDTKTSIAWRCASSEACLAACHISDRKTSLEGFGLG